MANNTVEATLRSKFEDGISRGVKQTQSVLDNTLRAMQSSGASLGAGLQGIFEGMLGHLERWREQLSQTANESDSSFKKITLGSAAMAAAVAIAFLGALKAVGGFLLDLAKEASTITELKVSFESLVGSQQKAADLLNKLKIATEGLVAPTDLLRNANRVLASGIPLTNDQYVRLVENISRLAKASGTDLTQALTATTDALIRGNSRGLQAVGIHLNVKDAVSQLAEQMGASANTIADHTRLQGFYNEMLQQTDAAVRKLPPGMTTLEDASIRINRAWRDFLLTFGEAINRSGVLQELLNQLTEKLWALTDGGKNVETLALKVNQFIISAVKGFADFMDVLSIFSVIWDTVWGTVKAVVESAGALVASALWVIQSGVVGLVQLAAKLPGAIGAPFRAILPSLQAAQTILLDAVKTYTDSAVGAFSGFGDGAKKAIEMANSARQLAGELEKFSGMVVSGARGTKDQAEAAGAAAANQQKLNEQLKAYHDLMQQIIGRDADDRQKAYMQLTTDFDQINKLTMVSEDLRRQAREAAYSSYLNTISQINEKELQEARDHQLALDRMGADSLEQRGKQMVAFLDALYIEPLRVQAEAEKQARDEASQAASATEAMGRAITLSRQGKIGSNVGADAAQYRAELERTMQTRLDQLNANPNRSMEDINEIARISTELEKLQRMNLTPLQQQMVELHEKFQRLNTLNMDPFHQTLAAMRENVLDFASQGVQAFASFFADLTSGQENAGKKLLAAFIGMIGQMLVRIGTMLVMSGIAEIALAQTLVGRFMGASAAAGAKAIATGLVLAAAGGIMQGAASSMAQTNEAGAGGSFQENVPRPTSANQVQVIQVGAPGRAQNPGQASATPVQAEVRVRLEPPKGWVVSEIQDAYRRNDTRLRTVIQNA
jgi:uncharacterized protein YlaN (UPF0358 family)